MLLCQTIILSFPFAFCFETCLLLAHVIWHKKLRASNDAKLIMSSFRNGQLGIMERNFKLEKKKSKEHFKWKLNFYRKTPFSSFCLFQTCESFNWFKMIHFCRNQSSVHLIRHSRFRKWTFFDSCFPFQIFFPFPLLCLVFMVSILLTIFTICWLFVATKRQYQFTRWNKKWFPIEIQSFGINFLLNLLLFNSIR